MAVPSMIRPLIVRPSKIWTYGSTVGATPVTSYQANWLADGRPSWPLRTSSLAGISMPFPTGAHDVNFFGLFNHNLDEGAVVTTNIGIVTTVPTYDDDGIPFGIWGYLEEPVNVSSASFSIAGHVGDAILGEAIFGFYEELQHPIFPGPTRDWLDYSIPAENEFGLMPDLDVGVTGRRYSGTSIATKDWGLDLWIQWKKGQRNLSLPSVFIPAPSKNDAWLGRLASFSTAQVNPNNVPITFTFEEYTRNRWNK